MVDYRVTDDGGDHLRALGSSGRGRRRSPARGGRAAAPALPVGGAGAGPARCRRGLDDRPGGRLGGRARAAGPRPSRSCSSPAASGPSREAFVAGRPVLVAGPGRVRRSLAGLRQGRGRGRRVRGLRSAPPAGGHQVRGPHLLRSGRARTLTSPEVSQLLIYAEVATDLLLDGVAPGPGGSIADLVATVGLRSEVFQAQGMVAVELRRRPSRGPGEDAAAAFLDGIDLPPARHRDPRRPPAESTGCNAHRSAQ